MWHKIKGFVLSIIKVDFRGNALCQCCDGKNVGIRLNDNNLNPDSHKQ